MISCFDWWLTGNLGSSFFSKIGAIEQESSTEIFRYRSTGSEWPPPFASLQYGLKIRDDSCYLSLKTEYYF